MKFQKRPTLTVLIVILVFVALLAFYILHNHNNLLGNGSAYSGSSGSIKKNDISPMGGPYPHH